MRKRQGFTLVELLVAMALIIFIMSILSYAFVAATTTFRDLKAAGDMAEKLRSATTILRRDLGADHFDGRRRMSDPLFWSMGPPRQGFFRVWQGGPNNFALNGVTAVAPNVYEGQDLDKINSYRSANHALHFTVHLRGNRQTDYFTAKVPSPSPLTSPTSGLGLLTSRYENLDTTGSTFNSQWAEVVYFLRPAIDPNTGAQETAANGTPLFTLYRRQLLLVNDNNLIGAVGAGGTFTPTPVPYPPGWAYPPTNANPTPYLELSCWQGYPAGYPVQNLYFNSPMDVTVPQRRFGMDVNGYPSVLVNVPALGANVKYLSYPTLAEQTNDINMWSADVLLTDVLSFDVRVLLPTANSDPNVAQSNNGLPIDSDPFVDLYHPSIQAFNHGNQLYPAPVPQQPGKGYVPPTGPEVFDTWSSVRDPLASTLAASGPPLNAFATLYDYSAWALPPQSPAPAPQMQPAPTSVGIPLWNLNMNPPAPIIKAVQIQLRVWDNKTQQTRQVTLVQAM
jgi:prepilin-type N-terminal cleavage/methylation domain-containing protein